MYEQFEIAILESKALQDIRAVHKNECLNVVDKYLAVDDIIIKLDKDIKRLKR